MTPPSDAALAARAAAGDASAFAALYDAHADRIHAFCERTLDSPHDAADATQQAFLGLLRRLRAPGREPVAEPAAYLFASARNACNRILAARGRVDVTDEPPELPPDPGPSAPEVSVLVADQRADVRAANRRLPARQRQALALRELGGLSYDEIGDILEIDANAVAQLLWRARLGLRAGVRRAALGSVAPLAPDCERAHALVAAGQDGRPAGGEDTAFLDAHLAGCRRCQAGRAAMAEAGLLYRAWLPALADPDIRRAVLSQASALLGAVAAPAGGGAEADPEAVAAYLPPPGQDPDDPNAASAALWAAAAQAQAGMEGPPLRGAGRRTGRGAGRPAGRRR